MKKIKNFLNKHYDAALTIGALTFIAIITAVLVVIIVCVRNDRKEENGEQNDSETIIVPYIMPQYIWY